MCTIKLLNQLIQIILGIPSFDWKSSIKQFTSVRKQTDISKTFPEMMQQPSIADSNKYNYEILY